MSEKIVMLNGFVFYFLYFVSFILLTHKKELDSMAVNPHEGVILPTIEIPVFL